MKTNAKIKKASIHTHGGGIASHINSEEKLRRSVMSCMLWEGEFYEDGESIANRICEYIKDVKPEVVQAIAVEARTKSKLRHVPLLICREMLKHQPHKKLVADTLYQVIERPDELTEFLALYWKDGKCKLAAQVKKGLARAFTKFDAYQLAKYNRDETIKLRDVLFLCHPKPLSKEQQTAWDQLTSKTLASPDTWEVEISAKGNNADSWTRLINEGKLGYMALLRNLRNMESAGVDEKLVRNAIVARKGAKYVLPFRFISASKATPRFADVLDKAFLATVNDMPKLAGKTVVVVDVSGSMYSGNVSEKSDINRAQAACAMAAIARELCEHSQIYATAGNDHSRVHKTKLVAAHHGLPLIDSIYAMCHPLGGGGIFMRQVMDFVQKHEKNVDRVIVITDEQDCSGVASDSPSKAPTLGKYNYIVNVGSYDKGIAYGAWTHISGWSENVMAYINAIESNQ